MCGIVGALAFGKLNKREEQTRQRIMRYMTTELLLLTETRGKDATGAAVLFDDGNFFGLKRGEKASEFMSQLGTKEKQYGGLMKVWKEHPVPARVYLGHARALSQGSKTNNANNHPIKIGNIVGIHNGTIKNDDIIIKNLGCKRDGQVDSESIFRLFEHYTDSGKEPFTLDMVQDVVDRLDGSFSVTLFNSDNPYQVPIFRDGRPAEFIFIKDYKLLFIVSDIKFWYISKIRYEFDIFYHGLKGQSLVSCDIEKKSLEDDSCMIFDLTSEVSNDTQIKDLGDWRKMNRHNKKWTTKYVYNRNTTHNDNNNNNPYKSNNNTSETKGLGANKRVFDTLARKYVTKTGDKKLEDKESAIIPTNKVKEDSKGNTVGDKKDIVNKINNADTDVQYETTPVTTVRDLTIYNKEFADNTKCIEKDWQNLQKNSIISSNAEDFIDADVKDVVMDTSDNEYIALAERSFKTSRERLKNISKLLDTVEVVTYDELLSMNTLKAANKVFEFAWKRGFIYNSRKFDEQNQKESKKTTKRELHIVNLKKLVLLLISFFEKTVDISGKEAIQTRLSNIVMNYIVKTGSKIDIKETIGAFNSHERSHIGSLANIISNANMYYNDTEK